MPEAATIYDLKLRLVRVLKSHDKGMIEFKLVKFPNRKDNICTTQVFLGGYCNVSADLQVHLS